jgi:cytochrome P450
MTSTKQSQDLLELKERFTRYLQATFEQRRREPREDLITALVQAEQDGGRLSSDELIGMVYLLLIAGYVTTVNLIANSTLSLIRNREQLELLRGDASLYPTAIEELLRYDGPLELSSAHFASEDIELDGLLLPRGAQIRLVMPSINRDPARFDRPDVLDLKRDPCPHLAFGQGIHYCLGAPLARLEGRIALRALIERAPDIRLAAAADGPWLSHPILRGPERLPLRF